MTPRVIALELPRTVFGPGARSALPDELAALKITRPLLVSDQGLVRAGIVARVYSTLGQPGRAFPVVSIFDCVTENPIFADADSGARQYGEQSCDGVVAIGGGSVIDVAKYIALLATNGGRVRDFAGAPRAPVIRCAPLVVIPTTAGTGSEASPDAGIHPDSATASVGMTSRHIIPTTAILDPELTVSLPPRLTAATGVDALSHCIEGFYAASASPITDSIALDGMRRAIQNIETVTRSGSDIAARTEMIAAAFAGGVAISMGLGPAHAIAITCGDQGFHHGMLSGIGLVCTLDLMSSHCPDRAASVAQALGAAMASSLSGVIRQLLRDLGLPATLAEPGYRVDNLTALATTAHKSSFNNAARYHPSIDEYAEMIGTSLQ